jgi:hypothetical protein
MPYIINKSDGTELVVIEDGNLDTSTSIGLLGRNYSGYGEVQNENFVYLLENFSNISAPARPVQGQLWFDTTTQRLNIYDRATWKAVGAANVQDTPPTNGTGGFWYKTTTNQLFVYSGNEWKLVGPEAVENFGETRMLSDTLSDTVGSSHAVIKILVNDFVLGIIASDTFTINLDTPVSGFSELVVGINLNSLIGSFRGPLKGNADTASALQNPRTINGVVFDGQSDITLRANTSNRLVRGTYLLGSDFDGSIGTTWSVDATANNTIGKVVARDGSGNFSAGTITANLRGTLLGNVSTTTGRSVFKIVEAEEFIGNNLAGNASSATRLQTARQINGVLFDGTTNITIPTSAISLTGPRLAPNVVESDLTSLGTLVSLKVADAGITIGNADDAKISASSAGGVEFKVDSSKGITFSVKDTSVGTGYGAIKFVDSATILADGGEDFPSLVPVGTVPINLGSTTSKFNTIYSTSVSAPTLNTSVINTTDPQNVVTMTSNVVIDGNLIVNGVSTIINSTQTFIDDILLTLAAGSVNPAAANGAGISIDGAGAQLFYSVNGDKWNINKDLDAGSFTFIGTATSARYADLAENYLADKSYEYGTVLEFGGDNEVTVASNDSTRVAGVVSQNPAHLMNSDLEGKFVVPVALQGRVFCKVKGPVRKGDMIVSAGDGFAKAENSPKIGSVIGKSIENFDGEQGLIEVVVGRV